MEADTSQTVHLVEERGLLKDDGHTSGVNTCTLTNRIMPLIPIR
jgi:hypothetical protein